MNCNIYYLLPCYNEELNLSKIIKKIYNFYKTKHYKVTVVFVDDGSNDKSYEIIKNLKKKDSKKIKINILKHKKNRGLGAALKTGFMHIFQSANFNDAIISMDTDNSHTIDLSFTMIKKIFYHKIDVVIASRYQKNSKIKGLNIYRKTLSYLAAFLFKIFYPIKNVKDYTSGFRAYKVGSLRSIVKKNKEFFSEIGFSVTADILLKLYKFRKKIKFYEVPIDLRYDLKQGSSKMKVARTIYLNLKILFIRKFFN